MIEEPKKEGKGKGGLWPWLIGAGVALGGWYFYFYDKKKKQAQALERQRQEELRTQEEKMKQESTRSEYPGRTLTLPKETGFSASERLRGMGVDVTLPSRYQERGTPYAG